MTSRHFMRRLFVAVLLLLLCWQAGQAENSPANLPPEEIEARKQLQEAENKQMAAEDALRERIRTHALCLAGTDTAYTTMESLYEEFEVLVAVSRHTKGMLGFAEASGVGVADKGDVHKLEAKETTEASAPGENVEAYAGRYLAPSPSEIRGEARPLRVFWVCYATDRCVIATQKVTVTILPRREAAENLVPPQDTQP